MANGLWVTGWGSDDDDDDDHSGEWMKLVSFVLQPCRFVDDSMTAVQNINIYQIKLDC